MGLDGVELVLSVEEEFAVTIEDGDFPELTSPRLLADYIVSRLGATGVGEARCLSQAGFYRIRSALVRHFGASRNDVRPDSLVRQFLNGNIRTQWRELKKAIGATHLPGLRCRKVIAYPVTAGLPLAGVTMLYLGGAPAWSMSGSALILGMAGMAIADTMADIVPENLRSIRALVPFAGVEERTDWTHEYVLRRVIQITATQLGIPAERILPDHHFVKDLGLDA